MLKTQHGGGVGQNFIYSVFTVSVNVFVLISGYFMINGKVKIKKIINLWLQVWFYTILTYALACALNFKTFEVSEFFKCFIPIIDKRFWFISTYLILYIISPFLNKIMKNCTKKEGITVLILVLVFSILYSKFKIMEVLALESGYSVPWFICLYLVGAYLKMYPPKIKKIWLFLIYLACTLSLFAMTFWSGDGVLKAIFYNSLDYTSPLVLVASVCLFLLFRDIRIKNKFIHNAVCLVSSCTFGIYLLDACKNEFDFLHNVLHIEQYYGSNLSALYVLYMALVVFLFMLAIELARKIIVWATRKIIQKSKLQKLRKANPIEQ